MIQQWAGRAAATMSINLQEIESFAISLAKEAGAVIKEASQKRNSVATADVDEKLNSVDVSSSPAAMRREASRQLVTETDQRCAWIMPYLFTLSARQCRTAYHRKHQGEIPFAQVSPLYQASTLLTKGQIHWRRILRSGLASSLVAPRY
jgi:hypothetical protein